MMIKSGPGLAVAVLAFGLFCVGAGWMALRLIRGNRAAVVASLLISVWLLRFLYLRFQTTPDKIKYA